MIPIVRTGCTVAGCANEGTHEVFLLLISSAASLKYREVVRQLVKLVEPDGQTPMRRCRGHQDDRAIDSFFTRSPFDHCWPALAQGFHVACAKKYGQGYAPDKENTSILFKAPDEQVEIDVQVVTPRGLEDLGKQAVSIAGDEHLGRARARS